MTKPVVLLLGATGLFGGLLAQRLLRDSRFDLVCAGRNEARLKTFCKAHGGRYYQLDRKDVSGVKLALSELAPFAVIDCAGPFQAYGDEPYHFARLSIEAGCHYLDIADANRFVTGFSELDELAKQKGVVALSGCSSTPAISSSVADYLTRDLSEVESLTTVIIPGNKAKRTLSVMRSILSQIGQPMRITRHAANETVAGWSETESFDLSVDTMPEIRGRLASFVDTPDIAFFTDRYNAKSVAFKAGLEIKLFHYALVLGRMLVQSGLVKSFEPMAGILRWLASCFEWAGSDAGGMKVSVLGQTTNGIYERREWDLIANDGHGPNIPTLPISIMLDKILDGNVKHGAGACLGEFTPNELSDELAKFGGKTQIHTSIAKPVFQQALGESFETLPAPIKALHQQLGMHVYEGRASIKGSTGLMGRMASWLVGFPSDEGDADVKVTITGDENKEKWVREFDGKPFLSHLSVDDDGYVQERFGPLSIRLGLEARGDKLFYPVVRGRLFGFFPFPLFLLPQSISHEEVDAEGRFVFDVELKFRFGGGRIAHYQGWLVRKV